MCNVNTCNIGQVLLVAHCALMDQCPLEETGTCVGGCGPHGPFCGPILSERVGQLGWPIDSNVISQMRGIVL